MMAVATYERNSYVIVNQQGYTNKLFPSTLQRNVQRVTK